MLITQRAQTKIPYVLAMTPPTHLDDRHFRDKIQPSQTAEVTRLLDSDYLLQPFGSNVVWNAVDYRGHKIRAKEDLPFSELGRPILRLQLQIDRSFQDAEREPATEKQEVIRHNISSNMHVYIRLGWRRSYLQRGCKPKAKSKTL